MGLFPLGFISQGGAAAAGGYDLISTNLLGSDTATVTLNSIPSTYKHLKLVMSGRSNTASTSFSNIYLKMNGSSSSAYWYHRTQTGDGAVTVQTSGSTSTYADIGYTTQNNANSLYWSGATIDFENYSSTNMYKTGRFANYVSDSSGTTYSHYGSVLYMDTAVISSLTLTLSSGSWLTGSRFSLYGIGG